MEKGQKAIGTETTQSQNRILIYWKLETTR